MLGSNPLFHQQLSLQPQEQRPGQLLGSEQTTVNIVPPLKYFSSYIGFTRQRAVVSEGQQSKAQQQEPGLEG